MAVEILARLAICGSLLVPLHPVSSRVVPVIPANHRFIRGRLVVDSSSPGIVYQAISQIICYFISIVLIRNLKI